MKDKAAMAAFYNEAGTSGPRYLRAQFFPMARRPATKPAPETEP